MKVMILGFFDKSILSSYIPSLIYSILIIIWIYIIKKNHLKYDFTLKISLRLLILTAILYIVTLENLASYSADVAFLLLVISAIQLFFFDKSRN